LVKKRIKHQLTVLYTSQQNEVIERRNKTFMEMARCLLYEKKLPLKFWAEAVNTPSYLLTRMTSRVLADKTPYKIWYCFNPIVDHLKVFDNLCYVLKPEAKRRKLDEKADIGILISYNTKLRPKKIYDLKYNKLVIVRDVKVTKECYMKLENCIN
jgi:hypothetical protein